MPRIKMHPRMLPMLFVCALAACGGGGGGGSGGDSSNAGGAGGTLLAKFNPEIDALLPYGVGLSMPSGSVLRLGAGQYDSDPDVPVPDDLRYRWFFGDGTTADGSFVERAFDTAGDLVITLSTTSVINRPAGQAQAVRVSIRPVHLEPLAAIIGGPGMRDGGIVAQFNTPVALLPSADGGVLVLDQGNEAIRKIDVDGAVSTVAGTPTISSGQLGVAGIGRMLEPTAFTSDAQGTIYVADSFRLLKVSKDGAVSAIPGSRYGGPAGLSRVQALAATPSGTLYVGTPSRLQMLKGEALTDVVVSGADKAVDGPVADARFRSITALAVDVSGDLWVRDGCELLRRMTPDGKVETVATVDNPVDRVSSCPVGLAAAPSGGAYVTTSLDVKLIKPDGTVQVVSSIAGANAVTVDLAGRLYTARKDDHTVTRQEVGGALTFGLSEKANFTFPAPLQDLSSFNPVQHFGIHPNGDIYFTDKGRLCRLKATDGTVGCLAGSRDELRSADGTSSTARLSSWFSADLVVNRAGQVYFIEEQTVRRYSPDTGEITTIAGAVGSPGDVDGTGATARLRDPFSLVTDSQGNLFALAYSTAARDQTRIIRITPDGVVTTLARHPNESLSQLIVAPDDQVYAFGFGQLHKVDGATLTSIDWPQGPTQTSVFYASAALYGPDGGIWALHEGYRTSYGAQQFPRTSLERLTLSDRRNVLWFNPIRRTVTDRFPPFEFNLSFGGMGIDSQGRLVLSESTRFGFWRLSDAVSAGM